MGGEATYVHLDVTREADWQAAVDEAVNRYGRLDVLVNNAGILKSTAIQYAREGIRCNSIHPGPIETDMIQDTLSDPDMLDLRMQRLPLGRVGKPEEIAYGVIYLASDESSFVTGSELVIDGGTTAQ